MTTHIEQRIVMPRAAANDEIGNWLWALEDTRQRTKEMIADADQHQIDALPAGLSNSIGTLLYHIALIEADYLSIDVLGRDTYLEPLPSLFPLPDRDASGRLSVVTGVTLTDHQERLDTVRRSLMDVFRAMTPAEFKTARVIAEYGYAISPAWTLHHLMQHEAQHRGEIGINRTLIAPQT